MKYFDEVRELSEFQQLQALFLKKLKIEVYGLCPFQTRGFEDVSTIDLNIYDLQGNQLPSIVKISAKPSSAEMRFLIIQLERIYQSTLTKLPPDTHRSNFCPLPFVYSTNT
jgi:hypothetical protein